VVALDGAVVAAEWEGRYLVGTVTMVAMAMKPEIPQEKRSLQASPGCLSPSDIQAFYRT